VIVRYDSHNKKEYELHIRGLLLDAESNIKEAGTTISLKQE
jgi:hypothetical protein